MYFSYKNKDEPKVYLIYSVFHEMICSLHVLGDDVHHTPRLEWSKNTKSNMDKEDIESIKFYYEITHYWQNMIEFIVEEDSWNKSVPELLDDIFKMEIHEFSYKLFADVYSEQIVERALLSLNIAPEIKENHIFFFENPKEYQGKIVEVLRMYYYKYFASEISFIEPIYIKKLKHQYELTKERSIYEYLTSLHPRIEITETEINFHKYKLFRVSKKDIEELLIFETSFMMPHLLIGRPKGKLFLTFPLYLTEYDKNKISKDKVDIFKAIADITRLQIIKQLYQSPKSTQKLAEKLKLSEAAISKNLKLMYNAKLVSKERDGNYVKYHLNMKMLDKLVYLLYEEMTS